MGISRVEARGALSVERLRWGESVGKCQEWAKMRFLLRERREDEDKDEDEGRLYM